MKIYSVLQIGQFHTNYCEDFLVTEPVGTDKRLIAVLDGCSMGTESAFASILFGKILRSIAKQLYYKEFLEGISDDLDHILKDVLHQLFKEAKTIKNQLSLDTNELLSTIILGIVDEAQAKATFLAVGDGLIYFDGQIVEYEQDNKPHYLGYHLGEDFESWFSKQKQLLSISDFKDLSICTDGIFTFQNLTNKKDQLSEGHIIDFMLSDLEFSENDNFLERKVRYLDQERQHLVTDDLAIVRVRTHP
ncbi:MAG: protein phosphatase 2C domain-containing protein [Cytophagales bacterium]|nr:protein phosphatase 2C domain-containing protein [Cytophagales bacterium]